MAKYNEQGQLREKTVVPFMLRFEPHDDVKGLWTYAQYQGRFNGNYMSYLSQLKSVKADATLYNVYATNAPP